MEIPFKYGNAEIILAIPDSLNVTVKSAPSQEPLQKPTDAILQTLEAPYLSSPLSQILENFHKSQKADDYICIVISDATRPVPSRLILQAIEQLLAPLSIPDGRIKILIATGLHRKVTPNEMKQLVGKEFLLRFDIINHDATDINQLTYLGENANGTSVYINSVYINAKIKILTGYVEPHFFAGYSGGRKSIVPGIAGKDTIMQNHAARRIASPKARFGSWKENPVYSDALNTLKMPEVRPDFVINVCLNAQHAVSHVAAGSHAAHDLLVQHLESIAFFPIKHRFDVVVCGNGGYPLDQNLYQAVKSMAIGELAVKKGGTIIAINECREGLGDPTFTKILNSGLTPQQITHEILTRKADASEHWQIQVLARILTKTEVYLISELSADQLGNIGLQFQPDFAIALKKCQDKYGANMSILVLPDGPLYLPRINSTINEN